MFTLRNSLIAASLTALARAQSSATYCDPEDPTTPPQVCSIRAAFGGNGVPNIVPVFLPSGALYVHYDGIVLGGAQQLAPERVQSPPGLQYNLTEGLQAGPQYVFIMFDPDAGSNADVLHYMLTDCSVNQNTLYLEGCKAAAPYGGPAPPQGTGLHRYMQLLYTQPNGFTEPSFPDTIQGSRLGWNFRDFVSSNNLGNPVGGMYFRSEYTAGTLSATNTNDPNTVGGATDASSATSASDSMTASSSAMTTSMSSAAQSSRMPQQDTASARAAAASASVSNPTSGAEKAGLGAAVLLAGASLLAMF